MKKAPVAMAFDAALEATVAMLEAKERLELCSLDGDEQPAIDRLDEALARVYALPGILDALEA